MQCLITVENSTHGSRSTTKGHANCSAADVHMTPLLTCIWRHAGFWQDNTTNTTPRPRLPISGHAHRKSPGSGSGMRHRLFRRMMQNPCDLWSTVSVWPQQDMRPDLEKIKLVVILPWRGTSSGGPSGTSQPCGSLPWQNLPLKWEVFLGTANRLESLLRGQWALWKVLRGRGSQQRREVFPG